MELPRQAAPDSRASGVGKDEPTAPSSGISLGCSRPNVQVLMFGRALRDFVNGGAATTSLTPQKSYDCTTGAGNFSASMAFEPMTFPKALSSLACVAQATRNLLESIRLAVQLSAS